MIYIVRHGQTEKNKKNILQGRSDVPLNEAGRQQALALCNRLRTAKVSFDKVYSSPLIRAIQTAEILAEDVPIVTDMRLIEMDYGPYEGMDLVNPVPEVRVFFQDFIHNPAPEGMEPLGEIVARLGAFLEEIKGEAKEKSILISTHAIAMKGALEYLTPSSQGSYWSKYIANCAVYSTDIAFDGSYTIPAIF